MCQYSEMALLKSEVSRQYINFTLTDFGIIRLYGKK